MAKSSQSWDEASFVSPGTTRINLDKGYCRAANTTNVIARDFRRKFERQPSRVTREPDALIGTELVSVSSGAVSRGRCPLLADSGRAKPVTCSQAWSFEQILLVLVINQIGVRRLGLESGVQAYCWQLRVGLH